MILTQTTIVLGAGASKPYSLLSGDELRSYICREGPTIAKTLNQLLAIDEGETLDFAQSFLRSRVFSIDAFLSRRDKFTKIGKLCIALALCKREHPNSVVINDIDDDWYALLWNRLTADAHSISDFLRNRIQFVTFNYDRSLEYFFHQSIKHTYGVSDDEAIKVLKKIEIHHVYGLLGEYHYLPAPGIRPYMNELNANDIETAANGIKIIPEEERNSATFVRVREFLEDTKVIGFLGFGFDSLNVKRIGLSKVIDWRLSENIPLPIIIVSALNKTHDEIEKISRSLCEKHPKYVQAFNLTNCMTIRASGLLG